VICVSALLKVENLSFKFNKKEDVLKDIDFEVFKGDFIGILGPNGSGKTTLLNNINRWLKPDSGCIYISNTNIDSLKPKVLAKHVSTVPQDISLDLAFTVEQLVLMGRNPYLNNLEAEDSSDFELAYNAMKEMDIWHLKEKPAHQLSGGEKQRVLIARALTQQPKIMLLDEPTSHLDINYQWELLLLLKKLCKKNQLTIIAILHDINLASIFCDKIILLKNHKIFKMGHPNDVINKATIKEVFYMDVDINFHQDSFRPIITFVRQDDCRPAKRKIFNHVHVICGGGGGERLLNYLSQRNYEVSVGILNIGDTDWLTAKSLGMAVIEEMPFSPLSEEKLYENMQHIERADVVVLADIPFGHGNIKNLTCLKNVVKNKKTFILEEQDISTRDYTDGQATKLYKEIKKYSSVFNNIDDLKSLL
jgi:iron complex transport system ATP-binding protein